MGRLIAGNFCQHLAHLLTCSVCTPFAYSAARCLSQFGVYLEDTTDSEGKQRFNSGNPVGLFNGDPLQTQLFDIRRNENGNENNTKLIASKVHSQQLQFTKKLLITAIS